MEVCDMNIEKEIKKAKLVNYSLFGITLFFVVLCLVTCLIATICSHHRHTFTQTKWINDIENRSLIVGDLLNDYNLIGMTQQEIEDLLGNNNNDYGYFVQENRYVYYLGNERTIIDSEWLLIDFKDNLVVNYKITQD